MQNSISIEELQRLLKDESERCNLHKQNYQGLKDEYNKLQEELRFIYDQLKETRSKNEQLQSSHESEVHELENKIKERNCEINSLVEKLNQLDTKKIRDGILQEVSSHYESKIKELYSETDNWRKQYNDLHYRNAILEIKYESRESEFSRALDKVKLEHLVEVDQLQNKINDCVKEKPSSSDTYAIDLKSAKREILELNAKIKVLLSECEELRAQNENLTLQISGLVRSNSKQSTDYANNLRILESEKIKVIRKLELCEKELSNAQEHRKALNIELQSNRQEMLSLQAKIEEIQHNSQITIARLQDEIGHLKSEWECEKEELAEEAARLKNDLKQLSNSTTQEHHTFLKKEQDLKKELVATKQHLWKMSNDIQQEREKYERKIRESEIDRSNLTEQLNKNILVLQQKLQETAVSKIDLEKEIIALRQQKENFSKSDEVHQSESCLLDTTNYQREIQDLKEKFEHLASRFGTQNEKKEISNIPPNTKNAQLEKDNEILQMKLIWEQHKLNFQQRLEELEAQLRECKNTSTAEKRELEFRVKQYSGQVTKLKEKLENQKEKLYSQKELLEKCVPSEVHLQVKSELSELQRRLEEYRRLITYDPLKQSTSVQILPTKTLSDIKNIDFRTFSQQASSNKDLKSSNELNKDKYSSSPKKRASSRRRPSKSRDRNSQTRTVSPVLTSSSDIDLENL